VVSAVATVVSAVAAVVPAVAAVVPSAVTVVAASVIAAVAVVARAVSRISLSSGNSSRSVLWEGKGGSVEAEEAEDEELDWGKHSDSVLDLVKE